MRCFSHHDRDAVGSCKYCGKGVCTQCAVDTGGGLACQGSCEEKVKALMSAVSQNIQLVQLGSRIRFAAMIFLCCLGGALIYTGKSSGEDWHIFTLMGMCFLGFAFMLLMLQLKMRSRTKK